VAKSTHSRGRQSELRSFAAADIAEPDEHNCKRRKGKESQKGAGSRWKPSRQPRLAGNWVASLDEAISYCS
jgi:hypothetical protein